MSFTEEQWRTRQESWRRSSEETIAQLRADLATAKAALLDECNAHTAALGLCKQREQELATVTAEKDAALSREADHYEHARTATESALKTCIRARERLQADIVSVTAERQELLIAERTAHASTRAELAEVRKALELSGHVQHSRDLATALESTRTELSAAQERVRTLESALHQAWKERHALPANVCEEIRTALRGS